MKYKWTNFKLMKCCFHQVVGGGTFLQLFVCCSHVSMEGCLKFPPLFQQSFHQTYSHRYPGTWMYYQRAERAAEGFVRKVWPRRFQSLGLPQTPKGKWATAQKLLNINLFTQCRPVSPKMFLMFSKVHRLVVLYHQRGQYFDFWWRAPGVFDEKFLLLWGGGHFAIMRIDWTHADGDEVGIVTGAPNQSSKIGQTKEYQQDNCNFFYTSKLWMCRRFV